MRNLWKSLLGLWVIGMWLGVSAPAQADSVGPYYATPSWDQTLPVATRFIVLSNFNSGAVLDRNTGLVWEKSPSTASTAWNGARSTCINKNVGGQRGFRLPSIVELNSLVDPSVAFPGPTLPPGHPFLNVPAENYWSATTSAASPTLAWGVGFGQGDVFDNDKAFDFHVWCVRGGMNADQY